MPTPEYIRILREKIGHAMLYVPAVSGVVINKDGWVLLQRRADNGKWALPGGILEPGEEPADCVVREVWEETGVHVIPERISGVYGGPELRVTYPNGDQNMYMAICFVCRPIDGEPYPNDGEAIEVGYFPFNALPTPFHERHRIRIEQALNNDEKTWFKYPD